MALITAPSYECKLYKRGINDADRNAASPIVFMAQIVGNKEKTYRQVMGFITPNTRLVIRTDSPEIYSGLSGENILAEIDIQGDIYQVQSITYDNSNAFGLGAGKFSREHNEQNAVKVITLV